MIASSDVSGIGVAPDQYPRFSPAEYDRRFRAVRELMQREGVEALVVYGSGINTGPVHYLSNFLATVPTWLIFPLAGESSLFVHFQNLIPCAKAMSLVEDVRCYHPSAPKAVADNLKGRGLASARIGVVGLGNAIPYGQFVALKELLPQAEFKEVSAGFSRIRWIRSDEELDWFRKSAYLTDLTCELLERRIRPGITEHDLSAIVHEAFLPSGGQMGIHFMATTSMTNPQRFVPWQYFTHHPLSRGDVVITEITIQYWSYRAQIHRPFAVAMEPTPLYRQLFDAALECFERVRKALKGGSTSEQIVEAASVIEERGFTVYDSVVHGEGGRNPELGLPTSGHTFEPWTFENNMVVVIQPNPITKDHTAGLQLGCAVVVTPQGGLPLHNYPFKFPVCG